VHDRIGGALRASVGYRGGTWFLAEAANRLLERRAHHPHPNRPSRPSIDA
jgi:hypothetical protein